MEKYTVMQWELDGDFSAVPGQEIAPEIYDDLLNVVPPLSLPRDAAQNAGVMLDKQERFK